MSYFSSTVTLLVHQVSLATGLCALLLSISGCSDNVDSRPPPPSDAEFVSIFNGVNLDGWRFDRDEADQGVEIFTVRSGELILDTPGTSEYAWLTYEKELTDFELKLEFVAYQDARGNSGIQFRDTWPDDAWYGRHGIDLASNVPQSTGFIWDFQEGWLPPVGLRFTPESFSEHLPDDWRYKWSTNDDPWNTLELTVIGNQVRSVLNGVEVINWDGSGYIQASGNIAIEVHRDQVFRFKFRNIELADLSDRN